MLDDRTFGELVREELGFLVRDHGFQVLNETEHVVELASTTLGARALFDPRGEVHVDVFLLDRDENHERWSCSGQVGAASVRRLLEVAAEQMQSDAAILAGDVPFYERLGTENRRLAREWTAYYEGRGPHPRRGKLPP